MRILFVWLMLTASVTAQEIRDYGGYLGLMGTDGDDQIVAVEADGKITVMVNDLTREFDSSYVKRITANALEGNNQIINNTSKPSWLMVRGEGSNLMIGGSSQDFFSGGYGDDICHGNGGNDAFAVSYGNDVCNGGEGNDIFFVDMDDVIEDLEPGDRVYRNELPKR